MYFLILSQVNFAPFHRIFVQNQPQSFKMKKSKFVKALLVISGITGICIGGAMLFAPVAFEASAGIILGNDVSLLSEIRAPGGTLLVAGVLILSGAFIPDMTYLSIILSCLFYLSYGLSRILSITFDGIPNKAIIIATTAEIILGLLSFFLMLKFQRQQYKT